ncbi:MAG: homocysteine S-methyltransferase family protein [Cyclobacteriaceae bacterium]
MSKLRDIAEKRILVLDGAMGTLIQRYKLEEEDFRNEELKDHTFTLKGNNDLLSVTRPDVIKKIHATYFEAGADLAETNTFTSSSIAQADYGLDSDYWIHKMNYESARIAREVADEFTAKEPDKPRFVVGSMGPTNRTASLSPDVNDPGYRAVTFDDLRIAFKAQASALIEGGVDALLVETAIDTLNVKAALFGIQELFDESGVSIPVMVSGTITDASGRTLSGQTTEAFLISISHMDLFSVGLNCALGASELRPYLQVLGEKADFMVSAHPNAGLPNEFGQYDQTPEEMGEFIKDFLQQGWLNVVGGCCGTTPEHIQEIARIAKEFSPREVRSSEIIKVN